MSIPKSSLNGSFPDNSDFQLNDTLKSQDGLNKKVIQGKAVEGKSNAFTTARDNILYPNGESIGSTIMESVVSPALKDMASNAVGSLFDIIKDSIDRIIFKDEAATRVPGARYTRSRGGDQYVPFASYNNSIFNNPSGYYNVGPGGTTRSNTYNNQVAPPINVANRWNNIILANRGEAETFIDDLLYTVNQYQIISLANVYAKLDWPSTHTETKWGWTPDILNVNTIIKRRVANGAWRIILPKPIAIEN